MRGGHHLAAAITEWNKRAEQNSPLFTADPDDSLIADACMWLRHDFGLLEKADKTRLMYSMREHWMAVWKAVHTPGRGGTLKPEQE